MGNVIGFDFGTTNSLISFVDGGRVINLLEDGLPHPSIVCYQGDLKIVGRQAKARLSQAGMGVFGNIVRSPKALLGQNKVYVEGVARNPKDIVADIVAYVREKAKQSHTGKYDKAVVTIPVDMNGQRRKDLREAFRMAGVAISQFVHEPLAALYGHVRSKPDFKELLQELNGELLLVFDWGGGTLDLTLCHLVDGMLVQIKNDGCNTVGGDIIDEMIRNEVIKRALAKRGIKKSLPIQPHGMERLLERAERAKIELSSKEKFLIFVSNFFQSNDTDIDLEYELSRVELEEICADKLNEGISRIHELLAQAHINPASIALCLATGGMVNMPTIKSRLREVFGPQRLNVSDRGSTIIAEGAAWIANDGKRLSLAKNIELYVAVNSHFPLVKAGTFMPREGMLEKESFNMYCTDPRDGVAKFQISCPLKTGKAVLATEPRTVLDNLSVKVHREAKPFFERLQLEVTIDDNLILKVSAFSSMARDKDVVDIHNIEFGLELPSADDGSSTNGLELSIPRTETRQAAGSISLRPNISHTEDKALVPGELMQEIDKVYMDVRRNPPQRQIDESLYYAPCSICKRPYNDPTCTC